MVDGVISEQDLKLLAIINQQLGVSFDNFEYTEAIEPPLTTLDKVEEEIGKAASELLLEKIHNKDVKNITEHLVKAKLIIRKSCGCE